MKPSIRIAMCLLAVLWLFSAAAPISAAGGVVQNGTVITVYPTGVDDTDNLILAFSLASAAGPRSTVLLAEGNFRTHLISVEDFDGVFKGMGQDKTFIDTFPGHECQATYTSRGLVPALFTFYRGYPRVSDLTIHITPPQPCQSFDFPDAPGVYYYAIFGIQVTPTPFDLEQDCFEIGIEPVSASITRITVEGESDGTVGDIFPFSPNVLGGTRLGGNMAPIPFFGTPAAECVYFEKFGQGEFQVTNSTVRKAIIGGASVISAYNSAVDLSHNIIDSVYLGFVLPDNSGSTFDIYDNRFENDYGNAIGIISGGYSHQPLIQSPTIYNITDNDFSVYGYGNGIVAWDFDNDSTWPYYPPQRTVILRARNNRMLLNPENVWGFWLEWVEGAQMTNNTVTGSSSLALNAGMWGYSLRNLFTGNDISGFSSASGSPYKVVLDWGTQDWVVTGVPPDQVLDLGISNLVSNTHSPAKGATSPAIQAAMQQKLLLMKGIFR